MENGDETFASPAAAAAADFEFDRALTTNGGVAGDKEGPAAAKAYDAAEIDALREAKRGLEEKLASLTHENQFLAKEAHRLEGLLCQAQEGIATAQHAAADHEGEAASLREKVKGLEELLASEKSARGAEARKGAAVAAMLHEERQTKEVYEEAVERLKGYAAAAEEEERTAAPSAVAPKEVRVASHGLVAAAAAGAAATAAIAVVFLHLKR